MYKIHKFYLNNRYIILDVNSGSVHLVDKIVWDIIDVYKEKSNGDIIKNFSDEFNLEDIKEALNEIKILEENELMFTEMPKTDKLKYNEEGIVKAMCLHVAHDCNLKCRYCFASQGDFNGEKLLMPFEVGKKALDFLILKSGNRKNLEVDFFGGEPLMNLSVVKKLVEYGESLEERHNKKFRFTITTNGMLLNQENMKYLNEKMDNVVLSLDGRKEINDYMRPTVNGKSSSELIIPKFLEFVKLRGDKSYYIRGTFTNHNIDFAKDVMYLKEQGFDSISIEPVVADPKEEYAITEAHLEKILNEYEDLSKKYIDINKNRNEFEFFHFMIDLEQGPCFIKRVAGCGAGVEYLAVTPEGDFYPCHQFVGNDNFKLGDIEKGVERVDIVDKFRNAHVFTKKSCGDCWAKFYCSGGCHANAFNFNNRLDSPYTVECEMEKKRIECAISIKANLMEH